MGMPKKDTYLLIFSVIFLVIDIVLALCLRFVLPSYIVYHTTYPADNKKHTFEAAASYCNCMRAIYLEGTDSKIRFKDFKNTRSIDKYITELMVQYPFLVSLSLPAYKDDAEHKIFACNGLVQSSEWILTSKTCVQDESEWYNLTVRSGSAFWSHLGQEHTVVDVVLGIHGDLVQLKISPEFSEKTIAFPSIKYPFTGNWSYAVSLGWDDKMYRQKLAFRYKYKMFDVEKWTTKISELKSAEIWSNSGEFSSKPLLTTCHQLIGMRSIGKRSKFLTKNQSSIVQDECNGCYTMFQDDTDYFEDVELCQN